MQGSDFPSGNHMLAVFADNASSFPASYHGSSVDMLFQLDAQYFQHGSAKSTAQRATQQA